MQNDADADVEAMLAKWDDMDELTMAGLLVLSRVIDKEIGVRKSNCSACKNIPPGCSHCFSTGLKEYNQRFL